MLFWIVVVVLVLVLIVAVIAGFLYFVDQGT